MKTTLHVERRVTALVDQCLKFTVPSDVWIATLAEHDGDVQEAFGVLNFEGLMELEFAENLVDEVLTVHETSIEVEDLDEA